MTAFAECKILGCREYYVLEHGGCVFESTTGGDGAGGDDEHACDGEDPNGVYEKDETGACVLRTCKNGFEKLDARCVEPAVDGEVCHGSDPHGEYRINYKDACELYVCKNGYVKQDDACVEQCATRDPNGLYEINQTGTCDLIGCRSNYELDSQGGACVPSTTTADPGDEEEEEDTPVTGNLCTPSGESIAHGVYKIDSAGAYAFAACKDGHVLTSDGTCPPIHSRCAAPANGDPNARYRVDESGACVESGCSTGYLKRNGVCVNHCAGDDPNATFALEEQTDAPGDGVCVKTCQNGYVEWGGSCVEKHSETCIPLEGFDAEAEYVVSNANTCSFKTCKKGDGAGDAPYCTIGEGDASCFFVACSDRGCGTVDAQDGKCSGYRGSGCPSYASRPYVACRDETGTYLVKAHGTIGNAGHDIQNPSQFNAKVSCLRNKSSAVKVGEDTGSDMGWSGKAQVFCEGDLCPTTKKAPVGSASGQARVREGGTGNCVLVGSECTPDDGQDTKVYTYNSAGACTFKRCRFPSSAEVSQMGISHFVQEQSSGNCVGVGGTCTPAADEADAFGVFQVEEHGKCVRTGCKPGSILWEGSCREFGSECTPTHQSTVDNALYTLDATGCNYGACKNGYFPVDDECKQEGESCEGSNESEVHKVSRSGECVPYGCADGYLEYEGECTRIGSNCKPNDRYWYAVNENGTCSKVSSGGGWRCGPNAKKCGRGGRSCCLK